MSKELIERLRVSHPDWYGDVQTIYKEAADRIEQLEAEIERLKSSPTMAAVREMIDAAAVKEASVLHEQLAACQAREKQLREFSLDQWWYKELLQIAEESGVVHLSLDAKRAILGVIPNLLAKIHSSSDTNALEALVQKAGDVVITKAKQGCIDLGAKGIDYFNYTSFVEVIDNLPAVTLNDLK